MDAKKLLRWSLIGLVVIVTISFIKSELDKTMDEVINETVVETETESITPPPPPTEPIKKTPTSKTEIEHTCYDRGGSKYWAENECELWYDSFKDGDDLGYWKEQFVKYLRNNPHNPYGYQFYVMGLRESVDDYGNKKEWREKVYITPTIKVSKPFYDELQKFATDDIQSTKKGSELWFYINFFPDITFESEGKDGVEELVLPDDY